MSGISTSPLAKAYLAPFLVFVALLAAGELIGHFGEGSSDWWLDEPKYWVYPLQTVACAALLIRFWRRFEFNWGRGWWLGAIVGVAAFVVWVAPQEWLGAARRVGGFDLWFTFGEHGPQEWNLPLRVLRLVIVVPLIEEIFWRGFLLRHLVGDPFDQVPPGTRSWRAFATVAALFAVAHFGPDFWPALITGVLYNSVAYLTRSIGACVIAHGVTNLLLGLYIFRTQQWGFW
ncbi:MAG: CAAX prenyl protease-related protein [Chthoniobacteraceae bacterium]